MEYFIAVAGVTPLAEVLLPLAYHIVVLAEVDIDNIVPLLDTFQFLEFAGSLDILPGKIDLVR